MAGDQLPLPGLPAPATSRRRTRHTFGLLRPQTFTDSAGMLVAYVATCRSCGCLRREANTGARLGAKRAWSLDGDEWKGASPPCIVKQRS